jgi:hypothetical protein
MKSLIPIMIAVGIAVAIILVMIVSIPYQEEQEQKKLAQEGLEALEKCESIKLNWNPNPFAENGLANQQLVNDYTNCVENMIEKYGTDEVKQKIKEANMPSYQPNEYEFEKPSVDELEKRTAKMIQVCQELFFGQIEELTRCIDNADVGVEYLCTKYDRYSLEYEECMDFSMNFTP